MKLTWDEFKDNQGHFWVALPYVIRAHGVSTTGEINYRLEGPGVESTSTDVELLKAQAEVEYERDQFRRSLKLA